MCCPLWPPCPQDPSHGQHLHAGSPTLIHTYLCGSMSFTSDTWGFIHMRLFILAWLPNLRLLWWVSTEEARGRSRGCSAWCLWSAMGNRRGYDALVTQECGDRMGQWGFPPCGHIQAVLIVQQGKNGGNLCTGKCAFQSNSISLSLLPLSSLSSPGTAWDVSVVVTCGEQCHVKFLWWLCRGSNCLTFNHRLYPTVFTPDLIS